MNRIGQTHPSPSSTSNQFTLAKTLRNIYFRKEMPQTRPTRFPLAASGSSASASRLRSRARKATFAVWPGPKSVEALRKRTKRTKRTISGFLWEKFKKVRNAPFSSFAFRHSSAVPCCRISRLSTVFERSALKDGVQCLLKNSSLSRPFWAADTRWGSEPSLQRHQLFWAFEALQATQKEPMFQWNAKVMRDII